MTTTTTTDTKYVTLAESVMKWYILNVIGSDQIHDFCNTARLKKITSDNPRIKEFISKGVVSQTGGAQYCINIPEKDEYIGMQCLECFNVFLDTIIEGGYIFDTINKYDTGYVREPNYNQDAFENKRNPENYKLLNQTIIKRCNSFINYIKHGGYICGFNNICLYDIVDIYNIFINYMIKDETNNTPFIKFRNMSNEYFENQYITNNDMSDNLDNPDNPYKMDIAEEIAKVVSAETLPLQSKKMLSPMSGGAGNVTDYSKFSNKLKEFIREMAFNFCGINTNNLHQLKNAFNAWKNDTNGSSTTHPSPDNLFFFEQLLLNHDINNIEETSTKNVNEQIKSNSLSNIQKLKKIEKQKGNYINCNYIPKGAINESSSNSNKIIINNSANIPSSWRSYICNTYPGYVDSQILGSGELNESGIYNMGFKDSNNNFNFSLNLDSTGAKKNTINIKFNNNVINSEKTCGNFDKAIWKKVDAVTALSAGFNNLYKNRGNKLNWVQLMTSVKGNVAGTTKSFYDYSLFKSVGDIAQEMTTLIVNGGRTISFPDSSSFIGDKHRFFVANDRLSANRFIITLNYGLENGGVNINKLSYGGYFYQYGCKENSFYLVEKKNQERQRSTNSLSSKKSRKRKKTGGTKRKRKTRRK
jgi:hypothetical protein